MTIVPATSTVVLASFPQIDLRPEDVEPSNTSDWLSRRLWVRIGNIDKVADRHIRKRDDLCLLNKFVAEVQDENDGNINI